MCSHPPPTEDEAATSSSQPHLQSRRRRKILALIAVPSFIALAIIAGAVALLLTKDKRSDADSHINAAAALSAATPRIGDPDDLFTFVVPIQTDELTANRPKKETSTPTYSPSTNWPTYSPTAEPTTDHDVACAANVRVGTVPRAAPGESFAGESSTTNNWNHGSYGVTSRKNGSIKVYAPEGAKVGDTLFLFLSRSDGWLPLSLNSQWTRAAECFKSGNGQKTCFTDDTCAERDGAYCAEFYRWNSNGKKKIYGSGKDLSTVVFYHRITSINSGCWQFKLRGSKTTWAIVTAISKVNEANPIRAVNVQSRDYVRESKFPSVSGRKNDVLLLAMTFDDNAERSQFQPPQTTSLLGQISGGDAASFVFGRRLNRTGKTGELTTSGPGGNADKDIMISMVVNRG